LDRRLRPRSCLEESFNEHNLDDVGDCFLAGLVALELDGEGDPGHGLRACLDDALDPGSMGLLAGADVIESAV